MKQTSAGSGSATADEFSIHLSRFLAELAAAGYVETTQLKKKRLILPFNRWVGDARLTVADVDEACVGEFLARPARRLCKHGDPERVALHQFLQHLRDVGVVPERQPSAPSAADVLVRRYVDYLRGQCGLCARTVDVYTPFVRAFVAAQRLPDRLEALDASAVRSYMLDRAENRSASFVRLLSAALRSFLGFLLSAMSRRPISRSLCPRFVAGVSLPYRRS